MRILIPLLIILVGLGLIIYEPAMEAYKDYKNKQAIAELEDRFNNGDDNINIRLDDNSQGDVNPNDVALGTSMPTQDNLTGSKTKALGILTISKINLSLAIAQGTTAQVLNSTVAGHEVTTAMPNEYGNCALASHRSLTYGRNFNRLNEIKVGDMIKIQTDTGTVNYKVFKAYIVPKTDISPLAQPSNKTERVVTLITCDPLGQKNPPNRIIIKARAQ